MDSINALLSLHISQFSYTVCRNASTSLEVKLVKVVYRRNIMNYRNETLEVRSKKRNWFALGITIGILIGLLLSEVIL